MDPTLKRLVHLINAYADSLADQERCLRQMARVLETEQQLQTEGKPSILASIKSAFTKPEWPVGATILTDEDAKKYGHPKWSTLHGRGPNGEESWSEPCSYPNEEIHQINRELTKETKT